MPFFLVALSLLLKHSGRRNKNTLTCKSPSSGLNPDALLLQVALLTPESLLARVRRVESFGRAESFGHAG